MIQLSKPTSNEVKALMERQWKEGHLVSAIKTRIKWYWEFNPNRQAFEVKALINNPGPTQRRKFVHMWAD